MGYHTRSDIPNYWSYADNFVLQDRMFEPNASWSLPEHLFQVSEWSALCTQHDNPASCVNALQNPGTPPNGHGVSREVVESLAQAVRRRIRESLANSAGNGTGLGPQENVANGGHQTPENGDDASGEMPSAPPEAGHEQT
jgi:phospholipase C